MPFSTVVELACHRFGWSAASAPICKSGSSLTLAGLHGIPGQSLSHHHRPLSDNLQRATGQCLRDIWSQQQQQRHGRLFSRSVTTERRWRRAACSRSPAPSSSRDHLSQVASGQASTSKPTLYREVWFGLVWFGLASTCGQVNQHCVVKFLGDNLKREVTQGSSCGHSSNIHQPII